MTWSSIRCAVFETCARKTPAYYMAAASMWKILRAFYAETVSGLLIGSASTKPEVLRSIVEDYKLITAIVRTLVEFIVLCLGPRGHCRHHHHYIAPPASSGSY